MSFDAKRWFEGLKKIVETDIQVIYFTDADDEYRKNVYDTIKGNELESIDLDKIVMNSPKNPKDAQLKAWELQTPDKRQNSLLELHNKQIINVYTDFSGLSEDEQNKVLDYAKDNKCRVTILSQITKKENELSKIAQSRLEKLRSESR